MTRPKTVRDLIAALQGMDLRDLISALQAMDPDALELAEEPGGVVLSFAAAEALERYILALNEVEAVARHILVLVEAKRKNPRTRFQVRRARAVGPEWGVWDNIDNCWARIDGQPAITLSYDAAARDQSALVAALQAALEGTRPATETAP